MKNTFLVLVLILVLILSSCQMNKHYFNYRKGGAMIKIKNTEQTKELLPNAKFVNLSKIETLSNEDYYQIVINKKTNTIQPSKSLKTIAEKSPVTEPIEKLNISKNKENKLQKESKNSLNKNVKRITAYLAYFGTAKVLSLLTGISYAASLWITFGAIIVIILLYFLLLWIALCYL